MLRFQRTALNLRGVRQELLASNIANADTPHFKARDIEFTEALAGALHGRNSSYSAEILPLQLTNARHLQGIKSDGGAYDIKYRTEFQPNADDNTVNMDIERSAFAENAVKMEAAITFIRGQLSTLQSAMQSGQ